MIRAKLRAFGDSIRDRTPDPPAVGLPALGERLPDADALGRAATLLVAVGSTLAGVGFLLGLLLRRRAAGEPSADRADSAPAVDPAGADETPGRTWDWEGPRVAPLVGLCGLVAMRQFVEWLGSEPAAAEA